MNKATTQARDSTQFVNSYYTKVTLTSANIGLTLSHGSVGVQGRYQTRSGAPGNYHPEGCSFTVSSVLIFKGLAGPWGNQEAILSSTH